MATSKGPGLLLAGALVISGCATAPAPHNLTAATLVTDPSVETAMAPGSDLASNRTFTVLPPNAVFEDSELGASIQTDQLLYLLRNHLEQRGYEFVESVDDADLIATLDGMTEYKTHYIPPQEVVVPQWVPGQTTYGTATTYGNVQAFGSGGSAYGTYTGTTDITTHTPGYMTTTTVTRPGQTEGYYYPGIGVWLFGTESWENVYHGLAVGTSNTADLRVASQPLLGEAIRDIPESDFISETFQYDLPFEAGVYFAFATANGNDFYPTVTHIEPNSPADRAGLELYDFVLEVNGVPLRNTTVHDVFQAAEKSGDGEIEVKLQRLEEVKSVQITPPS